MNQQLVSNVIAVVSAIIALIAILISMSISRDEDRIGVENRLVKIEGKLDKLENEDKAIKTEIDKKGILLNDDFNKQINQLKEAMDKKATKADLEDTRLTLSNEMDKKDDVAKNEMIKRDDEIMEELNSNLKEPIKIVIPFKSKGEILYTKSYWAKRQKYGGQHWCKKKDTPANFDFVYAGREVQGPWESKRPGSCPPSGHCDGHNEVCDDYILDYDACYINKSWHNWYKSYAGANKIKYNVGTVCE